MRVAYAEDLASGRPAVRRLLDALEREIETVPMSDSVFRSIADTQHTQGIAAAFALPRYELLPFSPAAHVLVLDRVAEPGNMGALVRAAAGAGFDAVLLSEGCTDPFAPKAVRASAGTILSLPVGVRNWESIEKLVTSAPHRYAADAGADLPYTEAALGEGCAILVGNEGAGLGAEAAALATLTVRIPLARGVESLNAAVAGSILMFEARRQRLRMTGE